jgi:hypothetical protein
VAASREIQLLNITKPVLGKKLFPEVIREAQATGTRIAIGIGSFVAK